MAGTFLVTLVRHPIGRMGLTVAALLVLPGLLAVAFLLYTIQPKTAHEGADAAPLETAELSAASVSPAVVAPSPQAVKPPAANSVIEATFGLLPAETPPKPPAASAAVQPLAFQGTTPPAQAVKTRMVKTIMIQPGSAPGADAGFAAPEAPAQAAAPMPPAIAQPAQETLVAEVQQPKAAVSPETAVTVVPIPRDPPERTAEPAAKPKPAPKAEPEPVRQALAEEQAGASQQDSTVVRVGRSAVNVRSEPSGSSSRLFVAERGENLMASQRKNGWVRVTDGQGRTGWIYSSYLVDTGVATASLPEAKAAPAKSKPAQQKSLALDVMVVGGQGVNVRSGPSSSSGKLFALTGGERVTVSQNQKGWLFVTDSQGRSGWAYSRYLGNVKG